MKMTPVVIVPSRNAVNLSFCLRSIWQHEPGIRVAVIDDGIDWDAFRAVCPDQMPTVIIPGVKPFVFARNVNLGILWAGQDQSDVIIMNDDALLNSYGGFTSMQQLATGWHHYMTRKFGIVSPETDNVGNLNQMREGRRPDQSPMRDEPRMLCFVCVLIPRATIDLVGTLDERYVGYGLDDDDYSLRVRKAGLKLGVYDGCFVDHASLKSSYRGEAGAGGNFHPNMKLFIEKWGHDNWGKTRETSDFRALFPAA